MSVVYVVPGAMIAVPFASPVGISPAGDPAKRSSSCACDIVSSFGTSYVMATPFERRTRLVQPKRWESRRSIQPGMGLSRSEAKPAPKYVKRLKNVVGAVCSPLLAFRAQAVQHPQRFGTSAITQGSEDARATRPLHVSGARRADPGLLRDVPARAFV